MGKIRRSGNSFKRDVNKSIFFVFLLIANMKKFLFLLILILATCCTILVYSSFSQEDHPQAHKVGSKTVVWAYSALKFFKPVILKQH